MEDPLLDDDFLDDFKALYKKEAPAMVAFAARFTDLAAGEDIVQDIFLKIWEKRSFMFLKEGIHTYLFHAVRHACLDYLKHLDVRADYEAAVRLKLQIEELYYNNDPDFIAETDERMSAVYCEIDKLPSRCREIFVMSYLEERKADEIAKLLNISKRTVESQLYKGLKMIRDAIKKTIKSAPE